MIPIKLALTKEQVLDIISQTPDKDLDYTNWESSGTYTMYIGDDVTVVYYPSTKEYRLNFWTSELVKE